MNCLQVAWADIFSTFTLHPWAEHEETWGRNGVKF